MAAIDPIRIVPLRTEEVAAVGAPQLTYRGGPLLTAVEVFVLFWGDAWSQDPQASLVSQINGFFDYALTSPLLDQLGEYSTNGFTIGAGSRTGSLALTTAPSSSVTDDDVQQLLYNETASDSGVPTPNGNSLYFVFLPPGVTVGLGGGTSCVNFCGYHNATGDQIYYAVMPFADCRGCVSSLSTFDAITSITSHELCEAITDPIPGQGWYDDQNGEIGDICAWQTKQLGSYVVQLEWSNNAGRCL